jgi:hypothetical protein
MMYFLKETSKKGEIMKNKCFIIIFISVTTALVSFAKIIYIPSEYQVILDAVNASVDGDTILVAPGIYDQQLSLLGKKITLASLYLTTKDKSYIDSTRLEYSQNGSCIISCGMSEDSSSKIIGFTIGSDAVGCNGIYCNYDSAPLISENIFKTNLGYGIECGGNSNPIIRGNRFLSEYYDGFYHSIEIFEANARIENNYFLGNIGTTIKNEKAIVINNAKNVLISGNTIRNFLQGIYDVGYETSKTDIINNLIYNCSTGILCGYKAHPLLINNSIIYNTDYGIQATYGIPEIVNCIFWGNKEDFKGTMSISHSCMWGCLPYKAIDNGGNIFRDPQFVDISNQNYRLKGYSPCIDAGLSDSLTYGIYEYDIDLNSRFQDGDGDKASSIDIGCYERTKAVNPAYVSGTITLSGGTGNIENVNVGIGATVYPDANGKYIFAISAPDSSYSVFATLNNYLEQEIKNINIKAGMTTQNINFNLEPYDPPKYLDIEPDTLKLVTTYDSNLKLKNISLIDIYIRWIQLNNTFDYDRDFPIPHLISPGDSCEFSIRLEVMTKSNFNTPFLDSLIIYFNTGSSIIPILYNPPADVLINESQKLTAFHLFHNYPNPFNPSTIISFNIPSRSLVSLKILDLLGREVETIVSEELPAGNYSRQWNAKDFSGGVYFYRLQAGSFIKTKKLILLK